MPRLARITAVVAAACLLGSAPASASVREATPDPDVPLLESNGGMAPVYVDVDNPERHLLDVSWTHEFGTQLAVSRTATSVSIVLPPEV